MGILAYLGKNENEDCATITKIIKSSEIYDNFDTDDAYINNVLHVRQLFEQIEKSFYKMVSIMQKLKSKLLGYWQIGDDFIMYFNSFLDNIQPYNNGMEGLLIKSFCEKGQKTNDFRKEFLKYIFDKYNSYALLYQLRNSRQHRNSFDIRFENNGDGEKIYLYKSCLNDDKLINSTFKKNRLQLYPEKIDLIEMINEGYNLMQECHTRVVHHLIDFNLFVRHINALIKYKSDKTLIILTDDSFEKKETGSINISYHIPLVDIEKLLIEGYIMYAQHYPNMNIRPPFVKWFDKNIEV